MHDGSELLQAFAAVTDGDDELDVALLVARCIDPATQPVLVRTQLKSLTDRLRNAAAQSVGAVSAEQVLAVFRAQGFGASPLHQVAAHHSHVGWVLTQQQGLPITQAVILMHCARELGLQSHGINFPGHYLVQVADTVVDPLAMQPVSAQQLAAAGQVVGVHSARALGLRMLNNLKALAAQTGQWQRVLELLDFQEPLASRDRAVLAALRYEAGEAWERLGVAHLAREAFSACLALEPAQSVMTAARDRLRKLQGRNDVVH